MNPNPSSTYPWRDDPNLTARFHPDHPDDLQVIVHDGGPRLSDATPELMWVNVTGIAGSAYEGRVLNEPQNLRTVEMGGTILFLAPAGVKHPFRTGEKYLSERAAWKIAPCDKCGFAETFDAPSDLIARIFPDIPPDAGMEGFTSFCPLCGGVQVVESVESSGGAAQPSRSGRAWWQFWK